MYSYFKIPFFFFFIASSLGLLLRWHLTSPFEIIQYPYLLHAHSHIMFLGWVFNALFLAFVYSYARTKWISRYRLIFIMLQVLVVGMLISFPLQGYGVFSIVFSTLHTLIAVFFIIRFFGDLKLAATKNSVAERLVKISLVFFLLSSLGPFALGFIVANGLGRTNWYSFAVYFYLHFQYNGFFLLGVFALFFKLLEERGVSISQSMALKAVNMMVIACVPAYSLSLLWANPGLIFNLLGLISAALQIVSLILFVKVLLKSQKTIEATLNNFSVALLRIILAALIVKMGLQLLSAFPAIARLSFQYRVYVIAYLHLVLVGIITLFLVFWYREQKFIHVQNSKPALLTLIAGLTVMELLLIVAPSWSVATGFPLAALEKGIFTSSLLLWVGAGWLLFSSMYTNKHSKS